MNPNESLFIYTDGVTEAMNEENEEYGEERLISFLKERATEENFAEKLQKKLYQFTNRKNSDDITAFLVRNNEM